MSNSESGEAVTPQRVAKILWRRKLVCLAVALVVFLGGAAFLLTRPPVYQSTSSVALLPVSNNAAVLPNYPNLIASLIPTYVQLVSSPVLLDRVAATVPFRTSGSQLAGEVHGESLSNAAVINIVAEDANPTRARQIAAAATTAFLAQLHGNGVIVPRIYGRPSQPSLPAGSRTRLLLAAMLAVAVILGLGAGLVWDRWLSRSHLPPAKAAAPARPPVLGIIPELDDRRGITSILNGPDAPRAHGSWQPLRTSFIYALLSQHMRSVNVMSPGWVAGNSASVAANLAASVAEMGMTVLLVDADVRHPALHEIFGLDNGQGLTSTVLDGADPAALVRPVPAIESLRVVTAGPPLPPSQHDVAGLYRQQLPRFMSLAELVIVSGPPFNRNADAALVAGVTDGVVLVLPSGAFTWEQLQRADHLLTSSGIRVLGAVLTGVSGIAGQAEPNGSADNQGAPRSAGPVPQP